MAFDNLVLSSYVDKSDSKLVTILLSVLIPIAVIAILVIILVKIRSSNKDKKNAKSEFIDDTFDIPLEQQNQDQKQPRQITTDINETNNRQNEDEAMNF